MKISKRAEYGLIAMAHLAKNKKIISIREIANNEGLPFEFLGKIFSVLEKAKLISAKHGANGGFVLAKSAKKITAGDIVYLLENMTAVDCQCCGKSKKCIAKGVWAKVDKALGKTLNAITLADLIK